MGAVGSIGRRVAGVAALFLGLFLAVSAAAVAAEPAANSAIAHFADASDAKATAAGRLLYAQHCAACHGKRLQGQPLWQLRDRFWGRRAPAHDETGHTWAHSDEELFRMVRYGRFSTSAPEARSYMPAFGATLNDEQILATLAFIKARWPIGLRVAQAMLNPGNVGLPASAAQTDWTLPPACRSAAQPWRSAAAP